MGYSSRVGGEERNDGRTESMRKRDKWIDEKEMR